MAKRDKLLDTLKLRFDYYSAQTIHKDIVSALGLEGELDAASIERVIAYLGEKVPGSESVVEALSPTAPAPEAAVEVATEAATEVVEAPAEDAPAAEAPEAEAPADGGGDDKKGKKGKKK